MIHAPAPAEGEQPRQVLEIGRGEHDLHRDQREAPARAAARLEQRLEPGCRAGKGAAAAADEPLRL